LSKKLTISRKALAFLGLGAIIAILAPVSVIAATGMVKIQDGNGNSKAQVDGGRLRVGDGSGAITVNGTGNNGQVPVTGNVGVSGDVSTVGSPTSILAQGDCDTSEDSYPDTGTIPTGTTVVGIVLSDEAGGSQIDTLQVKSQSSQGNLTDELFTLMDGQSQGAEFGEHLNFGPGIKLTEAWNINCTGQVGASQGNATWIVYGY
jgi:hypothetical protein